MPTTLIVAEKPSVARDIARVVGASTSAPGCLKGNGYTVTWAIGHLVTLPEPGDISPDWKTWRVATLPMLPRSWPLKVVANTEDQFRIVKRLLKECDDVICATDAGREGELIFRYIYEAADCRKQVKRLWISSLTSDAIRQGMRTLKGASHFDPLADAARARSRADWLVGMNLSRAYALTYGDRYFVGRVQTPTLALVVKRDREILAFQPEDYLELEAVFARGADRYSGLYLGEEPALARESTPRVKRLPPDGKLADAILARVTRAPASVHAIEGKTLRLPPPLLYNLTDLQRHANRLFGFSAARTLELAQTLYERHKLLSYPRTDSNHLSRTVADELPAIVEAVSGPYRAQLRPGTGTTPLGARYVDDAKVTDHHAILPTQGRAGALGPDERRIYDLVCRRLLSLWQGDYVTAVTTVLTAAGPDIFRTQGTLVVEPGWKILDPDGARAEGDASGPTLPRGLEKNTPVSVENVKALKKTTRPPPSLTDSALLAAMESAGRELEDRELRLTMRDSGLGTPATRAGIIETLLSRGYLERKGKALAATGLGTRLIDTVHPSVKSPELTARWEKELAQIQAGKRKLEEFMRALEEEIKARVQDVVAHRPAPGELPGRSPRPPDRRTESSASPSAKVPPSPILPRPHVLSRQDGGALPALLERVFGFTSFRPHQEAVCRAVVGGRAVLLVMPTGAGKSLCYQLPGLARGGTTLVVSPLVALIDDQVEKLQRLGLAAERIHSGRAREESRAVCRQYLDGQLDYLFIAPERLAVPGFPEMLKKRPLALIAVDEAHCISHWGHDFRPDYRLLGERLGDFRPTPVIALTATATPLVQEDIARQLGLDGALRSIHGFRRTNIAIQLAELPPGARPAAIARLLKEKDRLPAILYAPTRKAAESLADDLARAFRAKAYHAGMRAEARDRVQTGYLNGEIEVIVATIAFGMGIDKANVRTVIHAALPGSVEGYYQEIGRAGRDGNPSRAILFHSFADRKMHEFLFDKSYPDIAVLRRIHRRLSETPMAKAELQKELRSAEGKIDEELLERALEKLWIHKGARIDPEENVARGTDEWEAPYHEQREHRRRQLQRMIAFADSSSCRMLYFLKHFGDENDTEGPCGICDICRPDAARTIVPVQTASPSEQRIAARILAMVSRRPAYPAGRLHQDLSDDGPPSEGKGLERKAFERIVAALVRKGWIASAQEAFQKDGETITFRRLTVTAAGQAAAADGVADLQLATVHEPTGRRRKGKKTRRPKGDKARRNGKRRSGNAPPPENGSPLWEALRAWRLIEAKRKGIPAFRILTDKALREICEARPETEPDLLGVSGIGPALASRYARAILPIVREHAGSPFGEGGSSSGA